MSKVQDKQYGVKAGQHNEQYSTMRGVRRHHTAYHAEIEASHSIQFNDAAI
ncbi:hypothetical protein [Bifidobacterium tsurumiense]|uniref:hypothetical protein n=1 Tax=Bifidobacterium tsurumiense TaxID=356829 RepID=UPI0004057F3C|nr:hypothetical protein [Bifidobacterium tsurumiense]